MLEPGEILDAYQGHLLACTLLSERRLSMESRRPLTPQTVEAIAAQLADFPLNPAVVEQYAASLEPLIQMIESLRNLPLKEIEPVLVFYPKEG